VLKHNQTLSRHIRALQEQVRRLELVINTPVTEVMPIAQPTMLTAQSDETKFIDRVQCKLEASVKQHVDHQFIRLNQDLDRELERRTQEMARRINDTAFRLFDSDLSELFMSCDSNRTDIQQLQHSYVSQFKSQVETIA
jgi:hypothetical protein